MKFTQKKNVVADALKTASACLTGKPIVPILNNARIEANTETGIVAVTCTNLENRITASFDAEIESSGTTTLPAKKLLQILNKLSCPVTIETDDDNHATISSGTAKAVIFGLPPADFPEANEFEPETSCDIPAKTFSRLAEQGGYCVCPDESRKALTGVLVEIDSNGVSVVSTDGKRLALAHCALEIERVEGVKQYIVPAAAISLIGSQKADFLTLKFSEKSLDVRAGDVCIQSKLVDAQFPNYRATIPQTFKYSVTLDSLPLFAKNDLVSLAGKTLGFAVFTFSGNKLTLEADDAGESITDVLTLEDGNPYFDKPEVLRFNPAFIAAAIKACDDEKFVFRFNDGLSPVVFEFGTGAKTVIMPIRKGAASDTEEEKSAERQ